MWPAPTALVARERGLLLGAGDRDAEQVVVGLRRARPGVGGHGAQDSGDLLVAQRLGLDAVPSDGLGVLRQQLYRADAVAADCLEQCEGVGAAGAAAPAEPLSDALVVGQQVVEVVG